MKNRTKTTAAKSMIEPLEDRLCMSGDPHVGDPHVGGMQVGMGDGSVRMLVPAVRTTSITDGTSNLTSGGGSKAILIGLLLPAVQK